MRVWLLALFLVGFNIGLSLLGTSNFWYSAFGGQRYDFSTHAWYTPEDTSGNYFSSDYNATDTITKMKSNNDIGASFLTGVASLLLGSEAGGVVVGGINAFWKVITGIFTSTGTLLIAIGFPDYLAYGVQAIIDLVIIYGGLQFFLGRSGKTVE